MKFFLIISTFLYTVCFSQSLELDKLSFRANFLLDDNSGIIDLAGADDRNFQGSYYLSFEKNNTFESAEVGSSCGLSETLGKRGTYTKQGNKIHFLITEKFDGKTGTFIRLESPLDAGTFYFVKENYGHKLVRNLDDLPAKDYFSKLKLKVPETKNPKIAEVLSRYRQIYNQVLQLQKNKNLAECKWVSRVVGDWQMYAQQQLDQNKENEEEQLVFYNRLANRLFETCEQGN